jgi:LacI family transcriptional regulator
LQEKNILTSRKICLIIKAIKHESGLKLYRRKEAAHIKITLESVAERAGVSRATAARILGGYAGNRTKSREKVLSAAEDLGYTPNKLAKSLATRRSYKIGVILPDIENSYFAKLYRGIEKVCHEAGYTVVLGISGENEEQEHNLLQDMLSEQVEGIVVTPSDGLKRRDECSIPLISVDRTPEDAEPESCWVSTDNHTSSYKATAKLIDLGYRKIALIVNLPHLSTTKERIAGATEAAELNGIHVTTFVTTSHLLDDIVPEITGFLDRTRPNAVIANDAVICTAIVIAARELGMKLGTELGLITYDDEPWMSLLDPSISSIKQPVYEIGETAARTLMRIIGEETNFIRQHRLSSQFIIRGSISEQSAMNH